MGSGIVDKLLEKDVSKDKITKDDAVAARQRLSPTTKMEDLSGVDFVIEAVPVRRVPEEHDRLMTAA